MYIAYSLQQSEHAAAYYRHTPSIKAPPHTTWSRHYMRPAAAAAADDDDDDGDEQSALTLKVCYDVDKCLSVDVNSSLTGH